jgi:hypothetical protein
MDESYMNGYREAEADYKKEIEELKAKLRTANDFILQQEDRIVTLAYDLAVAQKLADKKTWKMANQSRQAFSRDWTTRVGAYENTRRKTIMRGKPMSEIRIWDGNQQCLYDEASLTELLEDYDKLKAQLKEAHEVIGFCETGAVMGHIDNLEQIKEKCHEYLSKWKVEGWRHF